MHRFLMYIFIVFVAFYSNTFWAQNQTDFLLQKNYKELEVLFFKNQKNDSVLLKKIATTYLKRAKKEKKFQEIVNGFYLFNEIYPSKQYLDSIIRIAQHQKNDFQIAYAYFTKAKYYLYEKRNIKKTLDYLNVSRKYAKENDSSDLTNRIDYQIAVIKSEHLNQKEEALSIFKTCGEFYANQTRNEYQSRYLNILHAIAETYIGLKKNDSTTYYNNLGYSIASKSSIDYIKEMKAYFTLCEGINQYTKKNYTATIDSINKVVSKMIDFGDKSNTIDSYYYLGKSHLDLSNHERAISYFLKTDSILETLTSIPQYKHVKTYEYLKNYYKTKNDLKNQNKYLDKLNGVLDQYLSDKIFINKKVLEDYDIPLLLREKEILIEKLNKNNTTYISGILILTLLLLASISLVYYQYIRKRRYRLRFEKLLSDHKSTPKPKLTNTVAAVRKDSDLKVPEKHVVYILKKLDEFEKDHQYLTLGITSQSLADAMETNVKYLSRVINHFKNKTFTQYLNELRINYSVKELQINVMLRKFTIKAIANEFGYHSAETFSNAFYKHVKIKPSYYIKELNKAKNL